MKKINIVNTQIEVVKTIYKNFCDIFAIVWFPFIFLLALYSWNTFIIFIDIDPKIKDTVLFQTINNFLHNKSLYFQYFFTTIAFVGLFRKFILNEDVAQTLIIRRGINKSVFLKIPYYFKIDKNTIAALLFAFFLISAIELEAYLSGMVIESIFKNPYNYEQVTNFLALRVFAVNFAIIFYCLLIFLWPHLTRYGFKGFKTILNPIKFAFSNLFRITIIIVVFYSPAFAIMYLFHLDVIANQEWVYPIFVFSMNLLFMISAVFEAIFISLVYSKFFEEDLKNQG